LHAETPATSPEPAPAKQGRSRLTNGATLPGVDGRSSWVRRLRDLINLHTADLGGEANVSVAEAAIIRRAATLVVELERLELKFAIAGEAQPHELELYQRTANSLRRLLESVGLQRRAKDVTPTVRQYLWDRDSETADHSS
jgi:hypothetical protein